MGKKQVHDRLVDAVLLGEFFDAEPDEYRHGEEQFIADVRIEYPEHVDTAERVARRVLAVIGSDLVPALTWKDEPGAQDPALSRDGRGEP